MPGKPPTQRLTVEGGVELAYQVFGGGPTDLVFVPGFASHVDLQWADPVYARFLRRLGELARVVVYDKRGVGASDRIERPATIETHPRDLAALVEAVSRDRGRVIILGFSDGSPAAALDAATHQDRCLAVVFCSSFVRTRGEPEVVAIVQERTRSMLDHWGEGAGLEVFAPSL